MRFRGGEEWKKPTLVLVISGTRYKWHMPVTLSLQCPHVGCLARHGHTCTVRCWFGTERPPKERKEEKEKKREPRPVRTGKWKNSEGKRES